MQKFYSLYSKYILKNTHTSLNIFSSLSISSLKDNIFTIALIGKPNVGKSSIFNKLSGGMNAITDSLPGLTRDRNEIVTKIWGGVPIRLVDTAGWENLSVQKLDDKEMKSKMLDQTAQALIYSDLGF